jgi:quercetin dioxygenase-like cupin family protein
MKSLLLAIPVYLLACNAPTENEHKHSNEDKDHRHSGARGYILKDNEGEDLLMGIMLKASPEKGSASVVVFEERMLPKRSTGIHYHTHADEFFYVLEGKGTCFLNDSTYTIKKGDFIFIPAGQDHAVRNVENLKTLYFMDKDGLLKDFREAALHFNAETPVTLEAVNKISNKNGTHYKTLEQFKKQLIRAFETFSHFATGSIKMTN